MMAMIAIVATCVVLLAVVVVGASYGMVSEWCRCWLQVR
jgi:hypothetical protein